MKVICHSYSLSVMASEEEICYMMIVYTLNCLNNICIMLENVLANKLFLLFLLLQIFGHSGYPQIVWQFTQYMAVHPLHVLVAAIESLGFAC